MSESPRQPETAICRRVVPAGEYWIHEVRRGQFLRIVDLEGNQAADTLFYSAADPQERYSASDTIQRQAALYLTAGSELVSTRGNLLLTIVADTCGRHDTLGGACSRESNTMRYALDKEPMHACRDKVVTEPSEHRAIDQAVIPDRRDEIGKDAMEGPVGHDRFHSAGSSAGSSPRPCRPREPLPGGDD